MMKPLNWHIRGFSMMKFTLGEHHINQFRMTVALTPPKSINVMKEKKQNIDVRTDIFIQPNKVDLSSVTKMVMSRTSKRENAEVR